MSDNLKQKTLQSMQWLAIDRFGQQGIQFVLGMILARNLARADYGVIAAVAVFIALGFVLVESGFSQALIKKKDTTETDYNSVFYFNFAVSILIYLLLYFVAPFIAQFYEQPDLVKMSRVIFLVIPINALYLVPFAQLNKAMNFKTMAIANISGVVVSGGVGISLALLGYGAWALVVQQLLAQLVRVIVYYALFKWRPKLQFSFQVIREFWAYSVNLLCTAILNVVFNNIFNILLPKYYSLQQAGDYTQGNKLNESVNMSFQVILTGSAFSLFSKIQDQSERLKHTYRSLAHKSSILTFPIMLVLIAMAKPMIFTLLSEKWLPAVPYFQLLIIATLFGVQYMLTVHLLNACGRSKTTFRLELFKKILILVAVVVGFRFSVLAMLVGYALASLVSYGASMFLLKKEIQHYLRHQISDFIRPFLFGLILAMICWMLSFCISNLYLLFALQMFLAVLCYWIWVKWRYRDLYETTLDFVLKRIKRQR